MVPATGQDELLEVEKPREKQQTWGCVAYNLLLLRNALQQNINVLEPSISIIPHSVSRSSG
jgi:hypothetical protein